MYVTEWTGSHYKTVETFVKVSFFLSVSCHTPVYLKKIYPSRCIPWSHITYSLYNYTLTFPLHLFSTAYPAQFSSIPQERRCVHLLKAFKWARIV